MPLLVHEYARKLAKYCRSIWRKILFYIKSEWADVTYIGVTREKLEQFLDYWRKNWLPELTYTNETFDCDDFALLFKTLAILRTKTNAWLAVTVDVWQHEQFMGRHVCNCVYLEDEDKIVFIEPQIGETLEEANGEIQSSDGWKYRLEYVYA